MKLENCLPYLKHPGSDSAAKFVIEANVIADKNSDTQYPVIEGMVDFLDLNIPDDDRDIKKQGIMFKINMFFSRHLDSKILTSVFASGGVGFANAKKKIKKWIDLVAKDKTLFLEPEEKSLVSHIGPENCLTVGDLTSKNVWPAKEDYPNLNASLERIPVQTASFQNIVSYFVIEHVKDPRKHFKELARILKPGGYLILGGPGDVYPSHRVPYNYFNVIRFGYHEMINENNLELVEEYFPAKSWVSILYLCYTTTVRNSLYNKNQFTKILQMVVFFISLLISPVLNFIALLLDRITPFDKKIYSLYIALVRKPDN